MAEAAGACFHCGEPLPDSPSRVVIAGQSQPTCCQGCAAAATFIRDTGLDDYYRLRAAQGGRARDEDLAVWDRDDIQSEHSTPAEGGREITVVSDDMRCAACAWLIDRALSREPGVHQVGANAVTGRITLRWDPARRPLSALLRRLSLLGYRVHLAPDPAREAQRQRDRRLLITRLGVAALGSMQAMMLAEALYLDFARDMDVATRDFFRWVTFLVSTPVVFFSGWPFIAGMLRELRQRRAGMDGLIASSILMAWGASAIETLRGGPDVWYDAAVMFVFFLLAARSLEGFARQRANAVVERLARARPGFATRLRDGTRESVPLAALQSGDLVEVAAGEVLPADGVLLDAGELDEALISGESRPVPKPVGAEVLAGRQCLGRPIRLQVLRTGSETRLSHLVRSVEAAQLTRPRLAEWADRIAHHFVVGLAVAAAVTFAAWWSIAPERAFPVMLAVLVVSCPCALSLAIPTALAAAHAALARLGVLCLRGEGLQRLAEVDTVVFDKTGTLTRGFPELHETRRFTGNTVDVLAIAATLETASRHPLAHAFAAHARDGWQARDLACHPGQGIEGRIDGRLYRIGQAGFATRGTDDGGLWLADGDGQALARFEVRDRLRDDAAACVAGLKALGIEVAIASGDAPAAVHDVAGRTGIARFWSRQSPENKLAVVRDLQARGHRVAMVGDGINDAPVLAGADVSLAMAEGAAIAHRAADFVLTHGHLDRLVEAIRLARRGRRILRQNLAWALAYNLIALPFAMLGWVAPWLAALGMTASSLLVTLNALRLQPRPGVARATPSETRAVLGPASLPEG